MRRSRTTISSSSWKKPRSVVEGVVLKTWPKTLERATRGQLVMLTLDLTILCNSTQPEPIKGCRTNSDRNSGTKANALGVNPPSICTTNVPRTRGSGAKARKDRKAERQTKTRELEWPMHPPLSKKSQVKTKKKKNPRRRRRLLPIPRRSL